MQKILISALFVALVVGDCSLKCPDGFMSFKRTPTAKNSMTSLWCVKIVFPELPMNVTTAKSLCEKEGSVLTTFENEEERLQLADALIAGLTQKNQKIGSMLLDGRRIPTCETQDLSVLRASPCNDPTTAFATSDKHTDSTFMFKNWASGEPSSSFYQQDIEACIQFTISPNDKRTKKLNDALCDYSKGPGNGATVDFWNFGAACGRVAEFK